jgi:isoquinoline 1-oxidoreductase beta subunit
MLISAAALEWRVPRSGCAAENSFVAHAASNRRLSYGRLAAKAAALPIPVAPPLKDAKDFKLMGKPLPRLDTPSKVDGSAIFGIDLRVPGMKYAVLARCPVIGGIVTSFDDRESKKISGVGFVGKTGDSAVAVVADSVWGAMEGRRVLKVAWDEGTNKDLNSAAMYDVLKKSAPNKASTLYSRGDVSKVAGRRIEAAYQTPLMAQAPMEPGNCTAHFRGANCEIWGPMQWPPDVRDAVAKAVGLDPDQVKVNVTLLGGGFGRRLDHDYAVEAALVSKAANVPIKVIWTREDDMRFSSYRPASYHVMSAVLDVRGWPLAFSHRIVEPSINGQKGFPGPSPDVDADLPDESSLIYSLPNALVEYVMTVSPVTPGFMRSVYGMETAFASESFIDELATATGKDPLEFRLHLLAKDEDIKFFDTTWKTARMRGVLQMAAEKAGWGKPLPAGRFRGIACFGCFGTYMAEVV